MRDEKGHVIVYSPGMKRLALAVQSHLATYSTKVAAISITQKTFANGEVHARIDDTVRHQRVFLFHEMQLPNPNIALMRMFTSADALSLASADSITLVLPYMSYLRQDRKDKPRVPITARMLANHIQTNRVIDHIITLDMHADQEQGFYSIPIDNLSATQIFADYVKNNIMPRHKKVVAVAPDFGSAVRTRRFAEKLGLPVAIVEKRRPAANVSEVVSVMGASVKGATLVIPDDMIDTGGTMRGVVKALTKKLGAKEAHIFATHAILSKDAPKKFRDAGLKVVSTDSIPRSRAFLEKNPWLTLLPLSTLLGSTISEEMKIGGSVSRLNGR